MPKLKSKTTLHIESILNDQYTSHEKAERKTKIICTITEKCADIESLIELLKRGMNVARFKLSGKADSNQVEKHIQNFLVARSTFPIDDPAQKCQIYIDNSGDKILTGKLIGGMPV